jgi:hypothetical protein
MAIRAKLTTLEEMESLWQEAKKKSEEQPQKP